MICPNCGMELDDNEQVCSLCGYEFTENAVADISPDMPQNEAKSEIIYSQTVAAEKKPKKNLVLIAIIAALAIIVIALAAFVIKLAADRQTQPVNNTVSVSETVKITQTDIIETTSDTESSTTSTTVTTTVTTTTEAVTEPPQTGEDYLLAYGWQIDEADKLNQDSVYRDYTLYDIDGNGIYEILMRFGTCEADTCYKIWTIDGNTVVYCGDIAAGHTYLSEMDGKLYINVAHMGYQHADEITLINNQIVKSEYYDSGDTMLQEYYTFGDAVSFYDFSDSSILSKFSTAQYESGHYTSECY